MVREFILSESGYWDPVFIFAVLALAFWQICSADMARRNLLLQAGLLLFYLTIATAVIAFCMLEPTRDPRENVIVGGVTVFFLASSLALLHAARGRVRDYGAMRAAFMLALLGATAFGAFMFWLYHGASVPRPGLDLPFALTAFLLFLAFTAALALEGTLYDLLVFRNTSSRVIWMYAAACTCAVFGYYMYMTRGLTRAFSL